MGFTVKWKPSVARKEFVKQALKSSVCAATSDPLSSPCRYLHIAQEPPVHSDTIWVNLIIPYQQRKLIDGIIIASPHFKVCGVSVIQQVYCKVHILLNCLITYLYFLQTCDAFLNENKCFLFAYIFSYFAVLIAFSFSLFIHKFTVTTLCVLHTS